ncbi:putative FAD-linked oxidoreductase [Hartmannibacter diazotrophicus]|uniref:Putative FAD-linked oxidoreductase n=2 Tax=Hartmannibacter diazotrophicus TaxID=1482074 RepID=A0A2C9D913_9HYPH|nr:putative FAD-linked oxidoreductase [Hartmannibacter diazotrophicus]
MTTRDPALDALAALLGESGILLGPADCARYATDVSGERGELPRAVLRPANTQDLSEVMRLCHRHGLPVVPQGGRTGLSGGASCLDGNLVLSLERMTGVIAIDPDALTLVAWAGTPLQTVQEAARERGLEYPVDIGSRSTATIGGTIATNAGGIRVIRHGMTRQNILGLEVVLANGTILSDLNELPKNNAGYDLKQLFIGSEGTLGIVTRAVMKLVPATTHANTALLGLSDYGAALDLLGSARRRFGPQLVAFEGMWPSYWDFVCEEAKLVRPPLSGRHGLYVLLETAHEGASGEEAFEAWLGHCLENELVEDGVIAKSLAETRSIWAVREAVGELDAAFGAHINFDLGIVPSRLGSFIEACDRALAAFVDCRSLHVGHMGDGNLHLIVSTGSRGPQEVHEIENVIYGLVGEWHGTVTAEHGVGTLKRHWLSRCRDESQIAVMTRLKALFDPFGRLNPGKIFE